MKIRFSEIIDKIFINFVLFLILFTWLKFLNKNLWFAFFLSAIMCFTINLIFKFFTVDKKHKYKINKSLEEDIELYMLTLISNSQKENLDFFKKILSQKFSVVANQKLLIFSKEVKLGLYPFFEKKELSLEDALKIVGVSIKLKIKKIYICCYQCSNKILLDLKKINNLEIKVLQKKQLYFELFRTTNIYPKIGIRLKEGKKRAFKEVLTLSFSKNKTKTYFLSGLLIFFCSFIVWYNFYYVFMSSLLFLFAILSFKSKEENFENEIF